MFNKILLLISFCWSGVAFAQDIPGFWCDNSITQKIVIVEPQSPVSDCVADLIWGAENVCYTGDAQVLVEQINQNVYRWASAGFSMSDALWNSQTGAIEYTGYDSQNFYSSRFDIFPCTD